MKEVLADFRSLPDGAIDTIDDALDLQILSREDHGTSAIDLASRHWLPQTTGRAPKSKIFQWLAFGGERGSRRKCRTGGPLPCLCPRLFPPSSLYLHKYYHCFTTIMTQDQYYVFPTCSAEQLSHPSPPTLGTIGGKALSLYETSSTFNVPPGFVLSVAFFQPWLDGIKNTDEWKAFVAVCGAGAGAVTKEHCDAIKAKCQKTLSLDASQEKELNRAISEAFGPDANTSKNLGIVAVRSSSPEEDLVGLSFAGGYDTTLGVTSDNLQAAIIDSFASLFDHRIYLYKVQHDMPTDTPRIAIIVQRQIASDAAGVGFSINPQNNCYDEITIAANFGVGESVVGGIVTPDTYIVGRFDPENPTITSKKVAEKSSAIWLDESTGGTSERPNKEPSAQALKDEQILEVAKLVAQVEDARGDGNPVDTEWAYCDGKLYLLQARPVTAYIPLFPEMVTERGAEKKLYIDVMVMTQGFSDPLSTLGLDLWSTILKRIKPTMSTDGPEGLMWNIHGREYMQISNILKTTGGKALIDKAFRTYDKSLDRALSSIDLKDYTPSKMPEGARGTLWKQLKQLWKMAPKMIAGLYKGGEVMNEYIEGTDRIIDRCHSDECSKDELFADAYEELMADFEEVMPSVGGLMSGLISRGRLHRMFRKCEGAEDYLISMCMDLKGNPTSEMGHMMVKLAGFAEIQETKSSEEFLKKLEDGKSLSSNFMDLYKNYLKRFGCRGMREIDVATPRTYENQATLFNTLKQIDVENNQIINVRQRRDKAYQALLEMAQEMGKEDAFKHHAENIQSLLGYREHPKYMLVVMIDRMRRHALNIGKELVSEDRLDHIEDIFALSIAQITEAQKDPTLDLRALVHSAMEPVEEVAHIKSWPVMIDSRGKIIRGVRDDKDLEEGTLLGDPISPGIVRGKAKVLKSPYEKPLESGEVLVARHTEPSWTPLFINAAGVVMEVGGPMQHGAIIAREYGIPCVSGLENATQLIKDGDLVEVDGSAGTVKFVVE